MMAFFDVRDVFRIGKQRKLRLGLWLIAVIALTLWLFFQNYRESEQAATACIIASLIFFAAELVWIFIASDRRVTPLILFLIVFYLVRNCQFLLVLFGVPFDVHHLVLLKEQLKGGIVLTSAGNVWAGYAGIVATVPQKELRRMPPRVALQDCTDERRLFAFLCIGFLLTGIGAYGAAILRFSRFSENGMAAVEELNGRLPMILSWVEALFVPFGFASVAYFGKKRFGAVAIGALTGYFLLTLVCGSLPLGVGGLVAMVFLICLIMQTSRDRVQTFGIFAAIGILVLLLSFLVTLMREPNRWEELPLRNIVIDTISEIGYGCVALLAALRIVPTSEPFLFGRGYAESLLGGILPPQTDSVGFLARLTADTRIYETWERHYFGELKGVESFPDAYAYLNFGQFGFLAIFVLCVLIAFLLNRYRQYERDCKFPKYAACVLLYASLTFSYRGGTAILRTFVWGVLLMALAIRGCGKRDENTKRDL